MKQALVIQQMSEASINDKIRNAVQREHKKLLGFIRSRIRNECDAEESIILNLEEAF